MLPTQLQSKGSRKAMIAPAGEIHEFVWGRGHVVAPVLWWCDVVYSKNAPFKKFPLMARTAAFCG